MGLFAPWIANAPPGSANELIDRVSRLIQVSKEIQDQYQVEGIQEDLYQVRRSLLGLPNSFEGPEATSEVLLKQRVDLLIANSKSSSISSEDRFMEQINQLERALHDRQGSVLPLVKKGPLTPLTEHQEKDRAPSSEYLFGTDQIGRDVFSFVVHGLRNSLFFALIVVFICFATGVILGGLMGYYGGWIDLILQRFQEIIGNFPIFLLQLTIMASLPPNTPGFVQYILLATLICMVGWIPYARFTRAEFLRLRRLDFSVAAEAIGATSMRRFFKHLLPNAMTPNITFIPFDIASTIITLGALSFLGFGEPAGTASLGELLSVAKQSIARVGDLRHWWLALFPSLSLFLLLLSLIQFNFAIRDFADPRKNQD